MCLTKLTEVFDPPLKEETLGYKVFVRRGYNQQLRFEYLDDKQQLVLNAWMHADTSDRLYSTKGDGYDSGFHVFSHVDDARLWAVAYAREEIWEVKVKNVKYKGTQEIYTSYKRKGPCLLNVLIADDLFVVRKVENV